MEETMPELTVILIGTVLVLSAVLTFIRIQLYMADPGRREFNEKWFAQFESYVNQRYAQGDLAWRATGLTAHWRD
jgi:hypothetical protein